MVAGLFYRRDNPQSINRCAVVHGQAAYSKRLDQRRAIVHSQASASDSKRFQQRRAVVHGQAKRLTTALFRQKPKKYQMIEKEGDNVLALDESHDPIKSQTIPTVTVTASSENKVTTSMEYTSLAKNEDTTIMQSQGEDPTTVANLAEFVEGVADKVNETEKVYITEEDTASENRSKLMAYVDSYFRVIRDQLQFRGVVLLRAEPLR